MKKALFEVQTLFSTLALTERQLWSFITSPESNTFSLWKTVATCLDVGTTSAGQLSLDTEFHVYCEVSGRRRNSCGKNSCFSWKRNKSVFFGTGPWGIEHTGRNNMTQQRGTTDCEWQADRCYCALKPCTLFLVLCLHCSYRCDN